MMVSNQNGIRKELYPEQISGKVLEKLKEFASKKVGREVKNAVITVPAYFNDNQKQATKDAAYLGGLEVKKLISEPTAAAMAYGVDKAGDARKMCLVFDFGGGTLDITILTIFQRQIEVKTTTGDTNLGGEDIDNSFMQYLLDEFKNETNIDLTSDEKAKARLRKAAKEAKHELTAAEETDICIDGLSNDTDFEITVTRETFNEICMPIFTKAVECAEKGVRDAHLTKEEIDEIIMVGGSTRIVKVQEMVSEHFNGKQLNKQLNPDEAVAIGATIQAGILSGADSVADIDFTDALPLSIGLRINNP